LYIIMNKEEWMSLSDQYIMGTYRRFPVVFNRGKGMKLWDTDDREYLDFVAGIAVCSLGHAHPAVSAAIKNQADKLIHVSNLYHIDTQIEYAKLLIQHTALDKVFFCNSGAEANEGAIKLAKKYGNDHSGGLKNEIVTMIGSFHGRTMATITATGQDKFHKGFNPLLAGFQYVPFNDLGALEKVISENTCAVMIEPIQAEGGIRVPDSDYFQKVRRLCDEKDVLLILDEVQVGMGRTGTLLAHEQDGIIPDIVTMAKAMGNGFPIGAVLAKDSVAAAFEPGTHASTFGGNPLAMAAAKATLETLLAEDLISNCLVRGGYFMNTLNELGKKHPVIREVRGRGLLIGMELDCEVAGIISKCMDRGLLIASAGPQVLRFVPPLIVSEPEIDQCVEILDDVLGEGA